MHDVTTTVGGDDVDGIEAVAGGKANKDVRLRRRAIRRPRTRRSTVSSQNPSPTLEAAQTTTATD